MTLLDELTEFLMTIRPELSIWEAQEFAEQYILETYTGRNFGAQMLLQEGLRGSC